MTIIQNPGLKLWMLDFPWSRPRLDLQTRVRTKFPNFLQQKIHLTFCNIHVLGHSFLHLLTRQIWARSHTYHHPQAEMQLSLLMGQNEYGFQGQNEYGFPGERGQDLLWARPKMPLLPGWLFRYLLPWAWETWPLNVIWSKCQVFSYNWSTSFHLPPVHLFTDFYLALFDWVSLGVKDAMLFQ